MRHRDNISEIGQTVGIVVDFAVCHQAAAWGYSSPKAGGGQARVSEKQYEPVDDGYADLLGTVIFHGML